MDRHCPLPLVSCRTYLVFYQNHTSSSVIESQRCVSDFVGWNPDRIIGLMYTVKGEIFAGDLFCYFHYLTKNAKLNLALNEICCMFLMHNV